MSRGEAATHDHEPHGFLMLGWVDPANWLESGRSEEEEGGSLIYRALV